MPQIKIDFLYIGPSKSASTWLYKILNSSPEIHIPAAKDLQFFDVHYEKGMQWYQSFFQTKNSVLNGEMSHDYLLRSNRAMARIREQLPDVKLICCVRDPFKRALSGLKFLQRNGLVTAGTSIADASQDWPELIEGGEYHANLQHVLNFKDRSKLLILNFDELERDPESFAKRTFAFLGVQPSGEDLYHKRVNASAAPRSVFVARVVKKGALALRAFGLPGLIGKIKTNPLVTRTLYKAPDATVPVALSKQDAAFLLPIYEADLAALEADFGIPTAHWVQDAREIATGPDAQETLSC